jgi:plastocyanin
MHRSLLSARLVCVLGAVAAGLVTVGPALASGAHSTATVTVTATEFKFAVSPTTVKHGTVTFDVVNKGKIAHNFQIDGKTTALLSPGKSAKLTVTLKAGKYPYKCTVDAHATLGMKGTLVAK